MNIQLSDHFTYRRLFRFVLPSILMMVVTSLYTIVDGFFVSNFIGKTAFAAVNLIIPVPLGVATIGYMVGSGGSAIVSRTLGERKKELANRYFSLLIYTVTIVSVILGILGFLFTRPISIFLGAEGELLEECVRYGRILFAFIVFCILQVTFQSFLIMAQKPDLSLRTSLAAGFTNAALDYVFIVLFQWGVVGAALATVAGQMVGGIFPLLYFARKNSSLLRLRKTGWYGGMLRETCVNGSSEMVTNLSASVVSMVYNFQLMKFVGETGVAAYGIIMYVNFVFMAVFFGYSMGASPIASYHYGAQNHAELKNIFCKSLWIVGMVGVGMTLLAEGLNGPIVRIFADYDPELYALTSHGFRIFSFAFLLTGFNVWGSAFFTALSNGVISALISFIRTLVFELGTVLVLPYFLEVDGIWAAVLVAEVMALLLTGFFVLKKREQYQYL